MTNLPTQGSEAELRAAAEFAGHPGDYATEAEVLAYRAAMGRARAETEAIHDARTEARDRSRNAVIRCALAVLMAFSADSATAERLADLERADADLDQAVRAYAALLEEG